MNLYKTDLKIPTTANEQLLFQISHLFLQGKGNCSSKFILFQITSFEELEPIIRIYFICNIWMPSYNLCYGGTKFSNQRHSRSPCFITHTVSNCLSEMCLPLHVILRLSWGQRHTCVIPSLSWINMHTLFAVKAPPFLFINTLGIIPSALF